MCYKKIMAEKLKIQMEILNWEKEDIFNSSPVIRAKIDMSPITLLIDTGASISFIDKKFVEKHNILKNFIEKGGHTYFANMLGGTAKSDKIVKTKNLTFSKKNFEHEFQIIDLNICTENQDLVYHGILGFDFLMRHKVELNFVDFIFAI